MNEHNKYSDSDLGEFKEIILKKIEHAEEDLALIKSAFKNDIIKITLNITKFSYIFVVKSNPKT